METIIIYTTLVLSIINTIWIFLIVMSDKKDNTDSKEKEDKKELYLDQWKKDIRNKSTELIP